MNSKTIWWFFAVCPRDRLKQQHFSSPGWFWKWHTCLSMSSNYLILRNCWWFMSKQICQAVFGSLHNIGANSKTIVSGLELQTIRFSPALSFASAILICQSPSLHPLLLAHGLRRVNGTLWLSRLTTNWSSLDPLFFDLATSQDVFQAQLSLAVTHAKMSLIPRLQM